MIAFVQVCAEGSRFESKRFDRLAWLSARTVGGQSTGCSDAPEPGAGGLAG